MGFEVVWATKAISTFTKQIAYLEKHWTDKEILHFTNRVNEYLDTLKAQPQMFRKSSKLKDVHIGVIIKQVSLIYRVKSIGDK